VKPVFAKFPHRARAYKKGRVWLNRSEKMALASVQTTPESDASGTLRAVIRAFNARLQFYGI